MWVATGSEWSSISSLVVWALLGCFKTNYITAFWTFRTKYKLVLTNVVNAFDAFEITPSK